MWWVLASLRRVQSDAPSTAGSSDGALAASYKIIDAINAKAAAGEPFIAFEYFPPVGARATTTTTAATPTTPVENGVVTADRSVHGGRVLCGVFS